MWRVWQPFKELEQRGFIAEWCHKDDSDRVLPLVASGRYDAVITPRIVWPVADIGTRWITAIHNAGLAWIYEIDDDVFSPRIVDRQMALFESEAKKGREQVDWERRERIRFLSLCDGVTTSSRRLVSIIRQYAPESTPVYYVPNAIDARWFRLVLREVGRVPGLEDKLTIGWAGGARESMDLTALAGAWALVAKRYPKVWFVMQGHMDDALMASVPIERLATLPWLPLHEYPRALVNVDIGCCVVAPLIFNTAKTCIKWYEMTLAGAPCVVTPTLYGREATHDYDALVGESAEEIADQLGRLIESAELRREINRNARKTVMEKYSLERNWHRWPEAWADCIEKYHARPSQLILTA